jgi:hypothetical protein
MSTQFGTHRAVKATADLPDCCVMSSLVGCRFARTGLTVRLRGRGLLAVIERYIEN